MKIKIIELCKTIRKNIINFISLSVFIFLAVTLFEGLDFTGNALLGSIDKTFKETNSYDIRLNIGMPVNQTYVEGFKDIDDIDEVEGSFSVCDDFVYDGRKMTGYISSLTSKILKPYIVSGHLPQNDNEIVIYDRCAKDIGLKIGDHVTFTRSNDLGFLENVINNHYTETSLPIGDINTHNFINDEFIITGFIYTGNLINHDTNAHPTDIITGIPTKACFFTNYSAFNPYITNSGFNSVLLKSNKANQYKYYEDSYKNFINTLKERVSEYLATHSPFSINDYNQYISLNSDLSTYIQNYMLSNKVVSEEASEDTLLLTNEINRYVTLLTAQATLVQLLTRNDIIATLAVRIMSNLFIDDRYAIGGVFFIISFLICFSVITRLVTDESKLIGTKKALGFKRSEIVMTYLCFSLIAVAVALIFGNIAGYLLQKILVPICFKQSMSTIFFTQYFDIKLSLIISVISLFVIGLITFFACNGVIKKRAITLLQDNDTDKKRKGGLIERTKLFQKASLFNKTVVRNFKHDLKRIFATVLGISASLALIIASFSLKFTVSDSFAKQFSDYMLFDTVVFRDTSDEHSKENLETFFNDEDMMFSPVYRDLITVTIENNEKLIGYVYVYYDIDSFNKLVHIDASDDSPAFANKGFWLPESFQKDAKCSSNANIKLTNSTGIPANCKTTGFYRYYNYQCTLFVDINSYEEAFGTTFKPNSYIINRNGMSDIELEKKIQNVEGYRFLYDYYGQSKKEVGIFDMVLTVVYSLYLFATAILSFFVILNLLTTNVREKKREIITLMINGYSRKKASKYVYLDTIVLTFISIFIGTLLGLGLSYFGQVSIESKFLYFIHKPNWISVIISIPITISLVLLMTLISLREIKKFNLTEINN